MNFVNRSRIYFKRGVIMTRLEKAFYGRLGQSQKDLESIGICAYTDNGILKPLDDIVTEIAKEIYRMQIKLKEFIIRQQRETEEKRIKIFEVYIVYSLVGVRLANRLHDRIYDKVKEFCWCNPSNWVWIE